MARNKNEISADMNVGCLIGENSVVEGNFITTESVRIDGVIRGNVDVKGNLLVGTKGKVVGNIKTESVMISGEVEGDVDASGKVEITSSGVVNGDIHAKTLIIDENAIFNGRCGMTDGKAKDKDKITHANISNAKGNAS